MREGADVVDDSVMNDDEYDNDIDIDIDIDEDDENVVHHRWLANRIDHHRTTRIGSEYQAMDLPIPNTHGAACPPPVRIDESGSGREGGGGDVVRR